jgi:hypothetical protein
MPGTHCPHAGPTGGDSQPADDVKGDAGDAGDPTPGVCGDGCEAFCNLVMSACTGANQQYGGSKDTCFTTCKTFPAVMTDAGALATYNNTYTSGAAGSGNFFCRVYHATAAATNPGVHCPHTNPANFDAGTGDPCH